MKRDDLKEKYPCFIECGDDYVVVNVDGDAEVFTIEDVRNYGHMGMSGLASFGNVMGDHRMISHIYSDIRDYFVNEFPEYFHREDVE